MTVLLTAAPLALLALGGYVCLADMLGWWPWHRRR